MMPLDERELAHALRSAVPQPPLPGDRAARARGRARTIRTQRRVGALAGAAAVVLAVALPVGLTTLGGGRSPSGPAPATTVGPHIVGPKGPVPSSSAPQGFCGSASCDPHRVLAEIRRPLQLPSTGAGGSCPASPVRGFHAGAGFSGPFSAAGKGPLHLAPLAGRAPQVHIRAGYGGWWGEKVIWVVSRNYPGPLLLRGGRVDGSGPLRFDHYLGAAGPSGHGPDGHGFSRLLYVRDGLHSSAQHVLESFPSSISMRGPGCYAVQVDGEGFSEMLVFSAVR